MKSVWTGELRLEKNSVFEGFEIISFCAEAVSLPAEEAVFMGADSEMLLGAMAGRAFLFELRLHTDYGYDVVVEEKAPRLLAAATILEELAVPGKTLFFSIGKLVFGCRWFCEDEGEWRCGMMALGGGDVLLDGALDAFGFRKFDLGRSKIAPDDFLEGTPHAYRSAAGEVGVVDEQAAVGAFAGAVGTENITVTLLEPDAYLESSETFAKSLGLRYPRYDGKADKLALMRWDADARRKGKRTAMKRGINDDILTRPTTKKTKVADEHVAVATGGSKVSKEQMKKPDRAAAALLKRRSFVLGKKPTPRKSKLHVVPSNKRPGFPAPRTPLTGRSGGLSGLGTPLTGGSARRRRSSAFSTPIAHPPHRSVTPSGKLKQTGPHGGGGKLVEAARQVLHDGSMVLLQNSARKNGFTGVTTPSDIARRDASLGDRRWEVAGNKAVKGADDAAEEENVRRYEFPLSGVAERQDIETPDGILDRLEHIEHGIEECSEKASEGDRNLTEFERRYSICGGERASLAHSLQRADKLEKMKRGISLLTMQTQPRCLILENVSEGKEPLTPTVELECLDPHLDAALSATAVLESPITASDELVAAIPAKQRHSLNDASIGASGEVEPSATFTDVDSAQPTPAPATIAALGALTAQRINDTSRIAAPAVFSGEPVQRAGCIELALAQPAASSELQPAVAPDLPPANSCPGGNLQPRVVPVDAGVDPTPLAAHQVENAATAPGASTAREANRLPEVALPVALIRRSAQPDVSDKIVLAQAAASSELPTVTELPPAVPLQPALVPVAVTPPCASPGHLGVISSVIQQSAQPTGVFATAAAPDGPEPSAQTAFRSMPAFSALGQNSEVVLAVCNMVGSGLSLESKARREISSPKGGSAASLPMAKIYLSSEELGEGLQAYVLRNTEKRFNQRQLEWLPALVRDNCVEFSIPSEMLYDASPPSDVLVRMLLRGRQDKVDFEDGLWWTFKNMVESVRKRTITIQGLLGIGSSSGLVPCTSTSR